MDMIRTLRTLLEPLVAPTSFMLADVKPLDLRLGRKFGLLEYHGTLENGRVVSLGLYQFAKWRTIAVEMWVPDDVRQVLPDASAESVAMHRQVWSYDLLTDGDTLARTIVEEVATWLQSFGQAAEPDSEAPAS